MQENNCLSCNYPLDLIGEYFYSPSGQIVPDKNNPKIGPYCCKCYLKLFIKTKDLVNHPSHYTVGGIEAISVIEAWNLNFCLGNALKYICRAGRKTDNLIEDLQKAQWYLSREIENLKKESN